MNVIPLVVGQLQTNCYLVSDPETRQTFIIDPADEADFISTTILEQRLTPVGIILTHGHYDHCLGALELKLNFNIPIYLHPKDLFLYQNAHKSATFWSNKSSLRGATATRQSPTLRLPPIDSYLEDAQSLSFGDSSLQVIHSPGHTPGSICLLSSLRDSYSNRGNLTQTILFTGDTIFSTGPGRTNLSYSSKSDLTKSIEKISQLPSQTLVYPGHEEFEILLDAALHPNLDDIL